jgi:lysophospholipase L1-like esterase
MGFTCGHLRQIPGSSVRGFLFLLFAPMKSLPILALAVLLFAGCATNRPAAPAATPAAVSRFDIPATDGGLPGAGPIRRQHDWFRKLWRERRTVWAGRVAQDQHALVFFGDSITQGWGDDIGGSFPGVKVANRGISGDTTRGMLIRLPEDVLSLHPAGVVLLAGTNDLSDNAEPWTVATNIRLIIDALKKSNPAMPVVLCEVMPSSAAKQRPAGRIQRLNQLLREAVRDQPQVTLIETWKLFADAQGDAKPEEFPDLLHPNAIGYAKWAAGLRPVFATLGFLETEPDAFTPEPGFTSLFNGHDLTGWGYRPTPEADIQAAKRWQSRDPYAAEWPVVTQAVTFDGRTASSDGRYVAKNGRLIVTTPPEQRKVQQLWTVREFPRNFVLKLEFRATPDTDSGIYLRGPQLQCRDYLLAGPYTKLERYKPQDWNEIVVTVKDRAAHCTCNGELLEEALPLPATGPIGLEGDRGQMEYRRIRVQELP